MKLHSDPIGQFNTVTAYNADSIRINQTQYTHSVIFAPESAPQPWGVTSVADLQPEHFQTLLSWQPEVVLIGTGLQQIFIHPRITQHLYTARIGVECMDNAAACRTYNILMSEGRRVAACILFNQATSSSTSDPS